jgi:hypothetical protein
MSFAELNRGILFLWHFDHGNLIFDFISALSAFSAVK